MSDKALGAHANRTTPPHDEGEAEAQREAVGETDPASGRWVVVNTARSREYCVHDGVLLNLKWACMYSDGVSPLARANE